MNSSQVILLLVNGLVWGVLLSLIALGLALTFGLTGIMNLAHGQFYMWGAIFGWLVDDYTHSFFLALIIAPILAAVGSVVIERLVLRNLARATLSSMIITFGLAIVLQQLALLVFGSAPRRLQLPELLAGTFQLLGIGYPVYRVFAAIAASAVLVATWTLIHRSQIGLWMRAVRHNPELASGLGIPIERIYLVTFALGSAAAALAGVLLAPVVAVEFKMGMDVLPMAFLAVILGGQGDLKGAVFASILLSVVEGLFVSVVSPSMAKVLALSMGLAILTLRPMGIAQFLAGAGRQPLARSK